VPRALLAVGPLELLERPADVLPCDVHVRAGGAQSHGLRVLLLNEAEAGVEALLRHVEESLGLQDAAHASREKSIFHRLAHSSAG